MKPSLLTAADAETLLHWIGSVGGSTKRTADALRAIASGAAVVIEAPQMPSISPEEYHGAASSGGTPKEPPRG